MYISIYLYIYIYICTRSRVRIPLGPTFYMESKNLSPKLIPFISANSATHPSMINSKNKFQTLLWRLMKGLAEN